ncbi:MAG: outer membrane protein assembly factor BamD [Balneolaceae bacterium]
MKKLSSLLVLLLILASCRSQELIRPGDSLEVAFGKAYSLYEEERWRDAASAFETVISVGRGTDTGQDAQYYLAESYYNSRQYLLAASEYERYSSSHPNSERRQEADFKAALSYYNMSPRFNVDQTNTRQAIERFRLFMARYPDADRAEEAAGRIDGLREKLARKNYEAAEFYMRTDRYGAAAVYYDIVMDQYPETSWAETSLYKQIDAYIQYADNSVPARQEERYRKAVDSYEKYVQLFPRGDNRSEAERLYDEAREALTRFDTGEDEDVVTVDNRPLPE